MRITQEADYALRIIYLLYTEGKTLDAKKISETTGVAERFTVKILRKLMLGGIVGSIKGVCGGYRVIKDAGEISMKDVVEVIDGPFEISKCLDSEYMCSKNGKNKKCCTFHLIFDKLNQEIMKQLEGITFDLLLDDSVDVQDLVKRINI